jgi:hypothetical protein
MDETSALFCTGPANLIISTETSRMAWGAIRNILTEEISAAANKAGDQNKKKQKSDM